MSDLTAIPLRISLLRNSFCAVVAFCIFSFQAGAQVTVTGGYTAAQLAAKLTGSGVSVFGATLTCASNAYGEFSVISSSLGIDSGVVLTSGTAISVPGTAATAAIYGVNVINGRTPYIPTSPTDTNWANTGNGTPGDPDLTSLLPPPVTGTNDACVLEFNFKPQGDTVRFNYVFGSEEYTSWTCTDFNDVFGFFITGGSYTTPTNLAKVPGTTIPVCINSVNCGPTGSGILSTCTGMGPGSPFCAYYVNNKASTTSFIMYDGLTTVLTALAVVSPCDTYHLKLGVADATDDAWDSGVFIAAGSLSSPPLPTISAVGNNGLPYCVRGCLPGQFLFTIPTPHDTATIIHYIITGTAVNGYDYTTIIDSVIIPIDSVSAAVVIDPTIVPPAGPKVVTLGIFTTNPCTGIDSLGAQASLTILDSFSFRIITPDSNICIGQQVNIWAVGDSIFDTIIHYSWAPSATIINDTSLTPIATMTVTTTYTLTGTTSALLGCPAEHREVTFTVLHPAPFMTLADTICLGMSDSFNVTVMNGGVADTQLFHYLWVPPDFVSNDTIPYPVITPTVAANYVYQVIVHPDAANCADTDIINLLVIPNSFTIYPTDTAICLGRPLQVIATDYPLFTYQWLPTAGIAHSTMVAPLITADTSATYVVTAKFRKCPDMHDTLWLDVQPNPDVYIGGNRFVCEFDTIHIGSFVSPTWYSHYIYNWKPTSYIDDSSASLVVFTGNVTTKMSLFVSTPAGCISGDSALVTVYPGNFAYLDTPGWGFCPHDSLLLRAHGGASYRWTPGMYLDDSFSSQPVIRPITSEIYTVVATSVYGCTDTLNFNAVVYSGAVIYLGDSVTLYPGETYHIQPQTNCTSFSWFPPAGLDNAHVSNPTASPEFDTKYIVHGQTEWGCKATDSIDIYVNPETLLALPNAFTPGNGPNNEFKIIKRGIATLKYFRIFNRWGNMVFETDNIDKGWNGEYNGVPQPFGVYVYEVEAVTTTGRLFQKHGNTTLIR